MGPAPVDMPVPVDWYLYLSAALFMIGAAGMLLRRNLFIILFALELMLNAVNLNLAAFWRYRSALWMDGPVFIILLFAVAAAETAVGLALIVSLYRLRATVQVEEADLLRG